MLAVSVPKSSLNLSLSILKEKGCVNEKKGFFGIGGPRTIVEITPEGERVQEVVLIVMDEVGGHAVVGRLWI